MQFWAFMLMAGLYFSFSMARASEPHWGLNDVSILFPIAEREALRELPQLETEGAFGVLLPKTYRAKLPQLLPVEQTETFRNLRLVAARIDPCFPSDASSSPLCLKQIRFVWQPIVQQNGVHVAQDTALHTFYALSDDEFSRLLTELKMIRIEAGIPNARMSEKLDVHPLLKAKGLTGRYFQELKRVLLHFTGQRNLSRVTFMTNHMNNNVWDFGGLDIENGEAKAITIPRIEKTLQRIVNGAVHFGQPTFFTGGIVPAPTQTDDNVTLLASNSRAIRPIEDEEVIEKAAQAAVRIQNPDRHNPNTMDCVSCHVAQTAFRFADRQFPWLLLARRHSGEAFLSQNFSLANTTSDPNRTDNLRAFGYFEQMPAISQRVINESARVAERLNAWPGR